MRPRLADSWREIAVAARAELTARRSEFRELAEDDPARELAQADGRAWNAIANDWTYYTTHQHLAGPDVSADQKRAAIARQLEAIARAEVAYALTPFELDRRDFLEAMAWHARPDPTGIAFCVSVTIEARRPAVLAQNPSERNAA